MPQKDITIYDIARKAGVSPATVSRVLTNSARVSAEKKEAVERIISEYNFRPNKMARSLSDTKSRVIGIMAADIRNQYYSSLVVECELAANAHDYTVMLCNALNSPHLETTHLEKFYEQRVDAMIQLGCRVDDRVSDPEYVAHVNGIASMIPFVISGKLEGADCYRVNIDAARAMRDILEYLYGLGHTCIALVGGWENVDSTFIKRETFRAFCAENGLPSPGHYLVESDYDANGGYSAMRALLARKPWPSAVVAVNDYVALGALKAFSESYLSVPGDISLVSFDNTSLARVAIPSLTTVDYNYPLFGKKLVETAIRASEGQNVPKVQVVETKLVIRESCAPIRG